MGLLENHYVKFSEDAEVNHTIRVLSNNSEFIFVQYKYNSLYKNTPHAFIQ